MSEPVVAREVAEKEVQDWCDQLGSEPDLGTIDNIVRAVMAGRASFHSEKEEFSYKLRRPLSLDNGESVDSITFGEPNARQLGDANKTKNEVDQGLRLLSSVSGMALGVLERMKQRDIITTGELISFFT